MELRLLFIIPFVVAAMGIFFLISLKRGMPTWLTATIGGLQPDDMRRLTPEHQQELRAQAFRCVPLAAAVTLLPGLTVYLVDFPINMTITIVCLIIQMAVMTILLTPLFSLAKSIKAELDLENKR